jgi:hypothetical protein
MANAYHQGAEMTAFNRARKTKEIGPAGLEII